MATMYDLDKLERENKDLKRLVRCAYPWIHQQAFPSDDLEPAAWLFEANKILGGLATYQEPPSMLS